MENTPRKNKAASRGRFTAAELRYLGERFVQFERQGHTDFEDIAKHVFDEWQRSARHNGFRENRNKGSIRQKLVRMIEQRDTQNIPSMI
jgi:hypothetical protein